MIGDWYLTSRTVSPLGPYGFARLLAYDVRDRLAPDRRRSVPGDADCGDAECASITRIPTSPPPGAPIASGSQRAVSWFRYTLDDELRVEVECTKCLRSSARRYRRWLDAVRAKVQTCAPCARKAVRASGMIAGASR